LALDDRFTVYMYVVAEGNPNTANTEDETWRKAYVIEIRLDRQESMMTSSLVRVSASLTTLHWVILYARHSKIVVEYLWSLPAASDQCFRQWDTSRSISIE